MTLKTPVSLSLLTALAAGCAAAPKVTARDDAYLRNKSLRIIVLDVSEGPGRTDMSLLRMHLAQRLRELGYPRAESHATTGSASTRFSPDQAAEVARNAQADAALAVSLRLAPDSPTPRRAEQEASVYTDVSGRREYYRQDLYGEGYRGPRIAARVSLVDAKSARVAYCAEYEFPAADVAEEALAEILLRPLEE